MKQSFSVEVKVGIQVQLQHWKSATTVTKGKLLREKQTYKMWTLD